MHHRGTDGRIVRWLFVTVLSCVPGASGTAMAGEDADRSALDRDTHEGRDRARRAPRCGAAAPHGN